MAERRYHMRLDFGSQGISTTEPMPWSSLRRRIVNELTRVTRPERVSLEVTPADAGELPPRARRG